MQGNNAVGRIEIQRYIQTLVDFAEQVEDGIDQLEAERDLLMDKLTGGADGKSLIAATINGKYFGWQTSITVEEKFSAFVSAIKIYNNDAGDSQITFVDFSQIT
jgi:hypothetical protein